MTWGVVGIAALVVLCVGVTVVVFFLRGCRKLFGPWPEDERRVAILAGDRLLRVDVPGLEPRGPLYTFTGGGEGPFASSNDATREYVTQRSPMEVMALLIEAAEQAGWVLSETHTPMRYIGGSRRDLGFGASLGIYCRSRGQGSWRVFVKVSCGAASFSPPISRFRLGPWAVIRPYLSRRRWSKRTSHRSRPWPDAVE